MDSIGNLLALALAIVSIATLAGLGLQRGTVTNLREQLKDAREEIAALKTGRTEDRAATEVLKNDLSALQRVVTGEVHWLAIGHQMDDHHKAATEHWQAELMILTEMRDLLRMGGRA